MRLIESEAFGLFTSPDSVEPWGGATLCPKGRVVLGRSLSRDPAGRNVVIDSLGVPVAKWLPGTPRPAGGSGPVQVVFGVAAVDRSAFAAGQPGTVVYSVGTGGLDVVVLDTFDATVIYKHFEVGTSSAVFCRALLVEPAIGLRPARLWVLKSGDTSEALLRCDLDANGVPVAPPIAPEWTKEGRGFRKLWKNGVGANGFGSIARHPTLPMLYISALLAGGFPCLLAVNSELADTPDNDQDRCTLHKLPNNPSIPVTTDQTNLYPTLLVASLKGSEKAPVLILGPLVNGQLGDGPHFTCSAWQSPGQALRFVALDAVGWPIVDPASQVVETRTVSNNSGPIVAAGLCVADGILWTAVPLVDETGTLIGTTVTQNTVTTLTGFAEIQAHETLSLARNVQLLTHVNLLPLGQSTVVAILEPIPPPQKPVAPAWTVTVTVTPVPPNTVQRSGSVVARAFRQAESRPWPARERQGDVWVHRWLEPRRASTNPSRCQSKK